MARIAGVDLPQRQAGRDRADVHLRDRAVAVAADLREAGVDPNSQGARTLRTKRSRGSRASSTRASRSRGSAARGRSNIKRLIDIGCYRGLRHRQGCPCAGQRTHTNARTRKGRRRSVGIKKKDRAKGLRGRARWRKKQGAPAAGGRTRQRAARRTNDGRPQRLAHIHSTFNNTIVTITDPRGTSLCLGHRRERRLQGLAQEHALRGAGGGRGRGAARRWSTACGRSRCSGQGPGRGPRVGDPRAAGRRPGRHVIKDVTPIPHNGCRPPKRRRV